MAVLHVAGLVGSSEEKDGQAIQALYESRIVSRQVNLNTGALLAAQQTSGDSVDGQGQPCVALAADQDPAGIRKRCNIGQVWFVQDGQHRIQQIILPVYGQGAKSMMHAIVALDTDGRTVKGLLYYDQNETPGLGGKVDDPDWRHQWVGKKILDNNGQPALKVVKSHAGDNDEYTVDGITGATLTSGGVENSINFWMGQQGYGHFLQRFRQGEIILQ